MDETAYRNHRDDVNRRPCVFEKAMLAGCADCSAAARLMLAERDTVACEVPDLHSRCVRLMALLQQNATFALKRTEPDAPWPHAQMMKLQCGGLRGLRDVVSPREPDINVAQLLVRSLSRAGSLEALPFSRIVQGISAWQGRRRAADGPAPESEGP